MTKNENSSLWAITCYFNPVGWERRLWTYRQFRTALDIPLLTVELGFQGRLDLHEEDADKLIQIPDGAVLWQKERLLNLAVSALPDHCQQVAWLDCDVLFGREDWPALTKAALGDVPLVQLFQHVHYLGKEWRPGDCLSDAVIRSRPSLVSGVATGLSVDECLIHPSPQHRPGTYANGMAWAARRDLLDRHGIYDACIIGGGDRAISCAAYGCFDHITEWHHLNGRQLAHYLSWARPFHADCLGRVGVLDTDIFHLWHGDATARGLGSRHEGLSRHAFDPDTDIAKDANGGWRWASDKPELHRFMREYFASRREDG